MNRTYLTRAIRELAGVYGYTIHIDTDDRTPREIVLLPAAWLPPIRLKEVEGRLHGRATYSVELRLLHPGAKLSSERRNEVWSQTELFLEILSTRDGSRIGSKRFYNTPTGTLNIAPMVRKNIRFVPSSGMTGFCNSESRSASVQLAVGTTYSEVRTFVAAHDSVKPSRILTTMPSHRIIAYGESDEITCCIPGQHTVTVTSDITAEALTYNAIGGEELTLFRLNTRSFLPSVGTITVRIATAGQTVAEIGYTVVPKCDEGCRIAWRSRAGSIEHYTFPVVKSVVQKIRKEQVLTDDAGYEDISIRDERTTTLASAFEPAAVIEALAEIAASPQVWKIDGDKYEEVDILTREQTIGRHGSLGCIEISLRPRQETRCL